MIKEDFNKKNLYQDLMKKAYLNGKKPRFHHGSLYIDGVLQRLDVSLFLIQFLLTKIQNYS